MTDNGSKTFGIPTRVLQAVAVAAATAITGVLVGFVTNINTRMTDMAGDLKTMTTKFDERTSASVNELISLRSLINQLRNQGLTDEQRLTRFEARAEEQDRRTANLMTFVERIGNFDARLGSLELLRDKLEIMRLGGRLDGIDHRLDTISQIFVRQAARQSIPDLDVIEALTPANEHHVNPYP